MNELKHNPNPGPKTCSCAQTPHHWGCSLAGEEREFLYVIVRRDPYDANERWHVRCGAPACAWNGREIGYAEPQHAWVAWRKHAKKAHQ